MKRKTFISALILLLAIPGMVNAQSKFSFMPGLFYQGAGFNDEVNGLGFIAGLEYMPRQDHFFSIELRSRYGYYFFDDGTKWTLGEDGEWQPPKNRREAVLEYSLFSPQIGIVPKFHLHLDESLSLFLENEFSAGLMVGNFKYRGPNYTKKNFTEPVFSYNIGVGAEYKFDRWSIVGSVGYSTLNFRSKIRKHQPKDYKEWVPNQSAGLLINVIFKIPL